MWPAYELLLLLGTEEGPAPQAAAPEFAAAGDATPAGPTAGVVLVYVDTQVLPSSGAHAEVQALVVLHEVFEVHPKRAVLLSSVPDGSSNLGVLPPQRAVVTPSALPTQKRAQTSYWLPDVAAHMHACMHVITANTLKGSQRRH